MCVCVCVLVCSMPYRYGIKTALYTTNKAEYSVTVGQFGRVLFRSYDRPERIVAFQVAHSLCDEIDTLPKEKAENAWNKMRNALGLSEDAQFVIHAMRHTCCTRLLANGVDLITAQHWMGHKDIRQTAAYAHMMPKNLDAAATALESHGQDASQAREVM